jgi:hypothetical protein
MEQSTRRNLYQLLSKEIRVTDCLIDVGCGNHILDLIDFEHSEFKMLKGIDKHLYQPFLLYKKFKNLKHSYELHQQFRKRFQLYEIDFKDYNYNFETKNYSLIICKHVLHFYSDIEKFFYLDVFYNSLQKDGLLFIKLNHHKNEDNTDLAYTREIESTVFQDMSNLDEVRYLIDPSAFLSTVREKYSIIENYTIVDEKAVSFVIRK